MQFASRVEASSVECTHLWKKLTSPDLLPALVYYSSGFALALHWLSDFPTLWLLVDCCDLLPAGRAQMQFPFSIFYMHIKRLFTFQFPASSLHHSPSPPTLSSCYKHIKINILQVAQKTAKDSATVEDAERRRRWKPLLWVGASAARGATRAGALSANPNVCWQMHENSGKLGESWRAEEKQVYFNFGYKLYEFPFILLCPAPHFGTSWRQQYLPVRPIILAKRKEKRRNHKQKSFQPVGGLT